MQKIEKINGTIERVTFHSEESGFCVLRLSARGYPDLVTVTGYLPQISAGEYVECEGVWKHNKKHGLQFCADKLKAVLPTSLEGIEKYLSSGMVKGIGPHFAKKLVSVFKEEVFDVIENEPHRLFELEGIGKKRKESIILAWKEQKEIRNIMVFLQTYGVGTARAVRIYKTYGEKAIEMVTANPYRLALDIRGIGFITTDALADRLGVAKDSSLRIQAGVQHVLHELCKQGHCAVENRALLEACTKLLGVSEKHVQEAISIEIQQENLEVDTIEDKCCIFPISLYNAERGVAYQLRQLNEGALPWGNIDACKALQWVELQIGFSLSFSQQEAIKLILQHKVAIITGGPGVGKTTLVNSLIKIMKAKNLAITVCAPTGRAAKRLKETAGMDAKTIHRLLEFSPRTNSFKYTSTCQLSTDVLIVDEASMLDISLFNDLLKAVPRHAGLILVGDKDQLPSVGSGKVLTDLIYSKTIITVYLTEIFRQAACSHIISNAHRINNGEMPLITAQKSSDFYTIYLENPEEIKKKLIELVTKELPKHLNFDPTTDIQVLTPMNRGELGSHALNAALQSAINFNQAAKISRYGTLFAVGDKVIQLINNYDKEVFNGDIGVIRYIDLEEGELTISFDDRHVKYAFDELDEITLAYAISIHKSQGSEFPVVIVPICMQHYALLARNLIYTAITRGKKQVVLIGQRKAIEMAVRNIHQSQRLTKLSYRLQNKMN